VYEGRGVYTVDGVDVIAERGDVVVVAANEALLSGDREVLLRHVAVFDSAHVGQEMKPT
jgi:hypothetical protein